MNREQVFLEAQKLYEKQIAELKQQLETKNRNCLALYSALYETLAKENDENVASQIDFLTKQDNGEINDIYKELQVLKQQLTEKDKEIEALKESKEHFKSIAENVVNLLSKLNKSLPSPQEKELNYEKCINDTIQQLAEKDKLFKTANSLRLEAEEKINNYKTDLYGLKKSIKEIRKLKITPEEKEVYIKGFENCERQCATQIASLTSENKALKQQLAELRMQVKAKDILIDTYMSVVGTLTNAKNLLKQLEIRDKALNLAREYMFKGMCSDDVPCVEWFIKCAEEQVDG